MFATVKVITPAKDVSLATLFEFKALMSFSQADATNDVGMELMLRRASGEIAAYCRRRFAEEEVIETFHSFDTTGVVFLSRYPVKRIISVANGSGALIEDLDWACDAESGMLTRITSGAWSSPLSVRYVGGYSLPHEAPEALRQAALMLCREAYFQASAQASAAASGIKMIRHKESSISYQNTNATNSGNTAWAGGSASGSSAARRAIGDLLIAYTKFTM